MTLKGPPVGSFEGKTTNRKFPVANSMNIWILSLAKFCDKFLCFLYGTVAAEKFNYSYTVVTSTFKSAKFQLTYSILCCG